MSLNFNPFGILGEILRWQVFPFLRKIPFLKNGQIIDKSDLSLVKETNYDGLELVMWGLFDEHWDINQKRLSAYKKSNLPLYAFHACSECFPKNFKGNYLNLAEDGSYIKKAISSHIKAAAALKKGKKTVIVFHPGAVKKGKSCVWAMRNVIENITSGLEEAKRKNVILTLENMYFHPDYELFCNDESDFQYIFEKIQHPNLKITFDWGHLNTLFAKEGYWNYIKSRTMFRDENFIFENTERFIKKLGRNIGYCHLHYNRMHTMLKFVPKNFAKDFIVNFFFWTELAKALKRKHDEHYDEHLTLNRIPEKYMAPYKRTIVDLLKYTAISDFGFITFEFSPYKLFGFFKFQEEGAKMEDYKINLKIFKSWLKEDNFKI